MVAAATKRRNIYHGMEHNNQPTKDGNITREGFNLLKVQAENDKHYFGESLQIFNNLPMIKSDDSDSSKSN